MAGEADSESGAAQPIHRSDLVSAASAVALAVFMFALPWYGLDQAPGHVGGSQRIVSGAERIATETGWQALTAVRWLVLLTAAIAVGALVIRFTQRWHRARTDTAIPVTLFGTLTAAVLVVRVLIDLPSPASVVDQKLGAYLGLLSAFGIALGGYHSLRTERTGAQTTAQRHPATPAGATRASAPR